MLEDRCCTPSAPPAPRGSRRRRLWELGTHAHCPVVGVCLPLDTVRKLAQRQLRLQGDEDDYTLHCALVTAAARRAPLAETLQRELEQRHRLAVQQAARCKTGDALQLWWRAQAAAGQMAGPLWATLTHAACSEALEMQVLAQVHMLQHQVGAAQRVDWQRHQELRVEHQALMRAYADAQQRSTRWLQERQRERDAWERERLQAEAARVQAQTRLALAEQQLQHWQAATPDLPSRLALQQRVAEQTERAQTLQRELNRLQAALAAAAAAPLPTEPVAPPAPVLATPMSLQRRTVLCVGGRAAVLPQYRQAVEHQGGQFLHHDGGLEQRLQQLDPQLAAADLVICQTGCISHDAYWRVKDHCKRHGKPCRFVESPSRAAFERALAQTLEPSAAG